MDPYLEGDWPDVHARLIVYAATAINRQLPTDLRASIERGLVVNQQSGRPAMNYRPDVLVTEDRANTEESFAGGVAVSDAPLTAPIVVTVPLPTRFIQVVDTEGFAVTAVEILSPSNKSLSGRVEYLAKQRDYRCGNVNLVEIDLTTVGHDVVAYPVEDYPSVYKVGVWRTEFPERFEIYPVGLPDRLPTIAVPLRTTDEDVRLDLQSLVDSVYSDGLFDRTDYRQPPPGRFDPQQLAWIDERLRAAGRR